MSEIVPFMSSIEAGNSGLQSDKRIQLAQGPQVSQLSVLTPIANMAAGVAISLVYLFFILGQLKLDETGWLPPSRTLILPTPQPIQTPVTLMA
jgi:hypothetical protein